MSSFRFTRWWTVYKSAFRTRLWTGQVVGPRVFSQRLQWNLSIEEMSIEGGRPVQRECDHRLQPLHCIHSRFSPGGAVSDVQNIQLSCIWELFVDGEGPEGEFCSGGGEASLPVVDLGVGIVADRRSLGGSTVILLVSGASTGCVTATMGSIIVELEEDIDVNVERLEGVVGSIAGLGGRRTRATPSSSNSISVIIVGADILLKYKYVFSKHEGESRREWRRCCRQEGPAGTLISSK